MEFLSHFYKRMIQIKIVTSISFTSPALGSVRQRIYGITPILGFLQNPSPWQLLVESHQQI
jgi:hypothetical protein